jgi:deoxyribodipyrimidine photo-lyase
MSHSTVKKALFWFRRDLRIEDNTGLYHALNECDMIAPVFIFDKTVLDELPQYDRRIEFIWHAVNNLKKKFNLLNSDIIVHYAHAEKELPALAEKFKVNAVYVNEDYEPQARQRDGLIEQKLNLLGIEFKKYKDSVVFSSQDLLNGQNQPYTNYMQYRQAWRRKLNQADYELKNLTPILNRLAKFNVTAMLTLEQMGFEKTNFAQMRLQADNETADTLFERFKSKVLSVYQVAREIPCISGVSYLSVYNRFGLISIRKLIMEVLRDRKEGDEKKKESCDAWLDEIILREFFFQLMYHFPHVAYEPFRREMRDFPWENNPFWFQSWCEGKTGFPLIDAAMIQLNTTGYMHNRLRMVVANFLTRYLLIDYHMGEFYFANNLLDFDLSANNGNWQNVASMGCETTSFIKMANPVKQSEKYDPQARFIKKYLPVFKNVPAMYLHEPWKYTEELEFLGVRLGEDYPLPIIALKERKELAIKTFEEFQKKI